MGKKVKLLQIEEFVVCPNCKRPFLRKSALKIKGAGRGYGFCGHCGFETRRIFKGTPAGEDIEISDKIKPVCKPNLDDF